MGYPSYLIHFNKNHDKLGRFTFGDGNGDGVSPDSYRTPELDSAYDKYSSTLAEASLCEHNKYTATQDGLDEKTWNDTYRICLKSLTNMNSITSEQLADWLETADTMDEYLFECYEGYRSIANLAYNGYDKKQIADMINTNANLVKANMDYVEPYKESVYSLKDKIPYPKVDYFMYDVSGVWNQANKENKGYKELDRYIDECVKLAKDKTYLNDEYPFRNKSSFDYSILEETKHSDTSEAIKFVEEMEHSDMADYLIHFNKNHDKLGRFAIGDGDGDGIRDDHANQNKETAGQKIKRAVDTYDSIRDDMRKRSLDDAAYEVKKENLNLQRDQLANKRDQEQTDVKSRQIDLSLQRQDARLQKLQMKNAMREERARAFIEKYRAKAEYQNAKAEAKALKIAEKTARQEAKNEQRSIRLQEKMYKEQERSNRRIEERNAAAARRQQQYYMKNQESIIKKYNSKAKRQKIGAFIALAASPIPFAAGVTVPLAVGLGAAARSNTNKAKQLAEQQYFR